MFVGNEYMVCQCCFLAIANGDTCDCPGKHVAEVTKGLDRLSAEGSLHAGDGENEFFVSRLRVLSESLGRFSPQGNHVEGKG